jgi:MFS family permease
MLQVGFGLSPFDSGLLTFVSAVGSLFMKTISRRILRRWGFRAVLVVNAAIAAASIGACALFGPTTPHALILAVLAIGGCVRSLQFTSINAITYADVEPREMSQATSMASVAQQISASVGVTVGAYALQLSQAVRGGEALAVIDFRVAFVVVALVALGSMPLFRRLDRDAGAELAGRTTAAPA